MDAQLKPPQLTEIYHCHCIAPTLLGQSPFYFITIFFLFFSISRWRMISHSGGSKSNAYAPAICTCMSSDGCDEVVVLTTFIATPNCQRQISYAQWYSVVRDENTPIFNLNCMSSAMKEKELAELHAPDCTQEIHTNETRLNKVL